MNESMISKLPDADMQAAPEAMLRAAQRAAKLPSKPIHRWCRPATGSARGVCRCASGG